MKWVEVFIWIIVVTVIAIIGNRLFGMNNFESLIYAFLATITYDIHCIRLKNERPKYD